MKKFLFLFILLTTFTFNKNIYASNENLLYTESEKQTITDGVTYEKVSRLYKSGWKDIYILNIDINNENVSFDVIDSKTEFGLKKSVEALASENGVVAAVNGDFFGAGNPTSSMGQVIRNGKMNEVQNYYNGSENRYAGIFLDKYGNAFIDYIKSSLVFYNSASSTLDLQGKNKISSNFAKPVYFDSNAIKTTSDLDKRVSGLYKIVVENSVITKISAESETVSVPENGYIIVLNKATAAEKLKNFSVGQAVSFNENNKFIFRPTKTINEILTGISGGGEILRNGKIISQGLISGPNARNPRTMIGVDKEKTKIIIMLIDGRGASVGATHKEAGELLLEYGAQDAIHLDGGGSTTLVLRNEGEKAISLENKPSQGSQRLVPNAIGIKSKKSGELASFSIIIKDKGDSPVISGLSYPLAVVGYDSYKNPINIDINQVNFYFEDTNSGNVSGNALTINSEGNHKLNATYGGINSSLNINATSEFIALKPRASKTSLAISENTYITASAVNKDGFEKDLNPYDIDWTLDNENIGYVQDGHFYAKEEGVAKLTATYRGVSASIEIAAGKAEKSLAPFEKTRQLYMMYFPQDKGISGGAGITNSVSVQGDSSLLLSYKFPANSLTNQVTYVVFEKEPLTLDEKATEIGLWVKGDNSENLLKMVLKGSDGISQNVSITDKIDFDEWKHFRVSIPANLKTPVTLDKIYVASLSTTVEKAGSIYIDDITSIIPRNDGGSLFNSYTDYLQVNDLETSSPSSDQEDITVFGQTANKPSSNSQDVLQTAINAMKKNARTMIFVGDSDIGTNNTGVSTIQWNNKYFTTNTSHVSIINLATKSGNMRTESDNQWRWLQSYLQSFSKNNIIINMDKDIWSSAYLLTGTRENELLHKILKNFVANTNKNVIVISATGNTTYTKVKDGVRYINLSGLFTTNPSNLKGYKYLRLRADENSISYQIAEVYK